MASIKRDDNFKVASFGVSTVDGVTPVAMQVNPATGQLQTSSSGGGGGTSSNFNAAFPSAGTAIGVKNGANMVALVQGSATSANSVPVVIASDQAGVPVTGTFWQATQPVSGTVTVNALPTGSNTIGKVDILGNAGATLDGTVGAGTAPTNMLAVGGVYNSTEIGPSNGQSAALQLDSKGRARMVIMDAAANTRGANVNANNAMMAALDQTTLGSTNGVTPVPAANSGWSFSYQSALTNSVVQVKGSAATFGGYVNLFNPNTATTYVQVFNKTSGNVTLGTTSPDFVITLPGVATAAGTGSDRNFEMVHGLKLSTAFSIAATTTASGSSAPANSVVGTILYV